MNNNRGSTQGLLPVSFPLEVAKTQLLKKHRCTKCNKLLVIEQIMLQLFDIKCERCGLINSISKDIERQVIITDKNGVILYVNEQVVAATGYSSHEILGKTPALWGNQMTREFYQEMWDQIAVQKKAIMVKVTNKHKNGRLYPVLLRISPILDVKGEVEFFIGMETLDEVSENHVTK